MKHYMNYLNIWYCITYDGQKVEGHCSLGDIQSSAGPVPQQHGLPGLALSSVLGQLSASGLFQTKLLCDSRIVYYFYVLVQI